MSNCKEAKLPVVEVFELLIYHEGHIMPHLFGSRDDALTKAVRWRDETQPQSWDYAIRQLRSKMDMRVHVALLKRLEQQETEDAA
jgi:hypothetical protein